MVKINRFKLLENTETEYHTEVTLYNTHVHKVRNKYIKATTMWNTLARQCRADVDTTIEDGRS